MRRDKKRGRKGSNFKSKLTLFQKPDFRLRRSCPLSAKGAPEVDYKNIKLLKKYISDTG